MIIWNPNTAVGSPIFSDKNLTVKMPTGASKVETTKIKNDGNYYFEIITLNTGEAPYVGIFNPSEKNISQFSYPPYIQNSNNLVTTNWKFTNDLNFEKNSVTGVAIDSFNKKIRFYKEGIFKLEKDFNFNTFNIIIGCGSNGDSGGNATLKANFGATEFDIVTSNPEEWNRLKSEGYLPYDIDSASWFKRSLIKSNNKYYTYQNNEFIEVEPTIENFENNSINLLQLTTPTNKAVLTMEDGEVLEDGKLYRKTIDISKYKDIERIEVR